MTPGGIADVEISGAGAANVLDAAALAGVAAALESAVAGGAAGAVLHGPPGRFAAGADLGELQRLDGPGAMRFARRGACFFRDLERSPLWLAAAVDGPCIGGALDLALACDLILATPRARFRHPGTGFGFPTTYGGNRRLPARVGAARARELLLGGRDLSAPEALEWGLVAELVPPAGLASRAAERLARWATTAPAATARALQSVFRRAPRLPLQAAVALERAALRLADGGPRPAPPAC